MNTMSQRLQQLQHPPPQGSTGMRSSAPVLLILKTIHSTWEILNNDKPDIMLDKFLAPRCIGLQPSNVTPSHPHIVQGFSIMNDMYPLRIQKKFLLLPVKPRWLINEVTYHRSLSGPTLKSSRCQGPKIKKISWIPESYWWFGHGDDHTKSETQ